MANKPSDHDEKKKNSLRINLNYWLSLIKFEKYHFGLSFLSLSCFNRLVGHISDIAWGDYS